MTEIKNLNIAYLAKISTRLKVALKSKSNQAILKAIIDNPGMSVLDIWVLSRLKERSDVSFKLAQLRKANLVYFTKDYNNKSVHRYFPNESTLAYFLKLEL